MHELWVAFSRESIDTTRKFVRFVGYAQSFKAEWGNGYNVQNILYGGDELSRMGMAVCVWLCQANGVAELYVL